MTPPKQNPEPGTNNSAKRRVAVVAIHGIGDHPQFQTAREIGDLLQDLDEKGNEPRYVPFKERQLRLNIRPVRVNDKDKDEANAHTGDPGTYGPLDSMSRAVSQDKMSLESAVDNSTETVDHKFMASQLAHYEGDKPEDTYQTIRLEGARTPAEGPPRDVDVYEMYWSDLTKTGNSFTSIFGELYELLFHLGTLGTQTVGAALAHFKNKRWARFNRVQMLAASFLALPLPILNLFMLALTGIVLATSLLAKISTWHEFAIGESVTCVAVAVLVGTARSRGGRLKFTRFLIPLVLCVVVAGALAVLGKLNADWLTNHSQWVEGGCAILLAAIFGFLVASVVRVYDRNRPGAKKTARWGLLALVVAIVVVVVFWPERLIVLNTPMPHITIVACVNVIEIANFLIQACWFGFLILTILAHFCGWSATRSVGSGDSADRARALRSRWSARLMLAIPSFAYIALTLTVWAGIVALAKTVLPDKIPYTSVITGNNQDSLLEWANKALAWAGAEWLPILAIIAAVAVIPMIWGLFPAIWDELKPPVEKTKRAMADAAGGLGDWLTYGYRFMRVSGDLLYFGMAAVVPILVAIRIWMLVKHVPVPPEMRAIGLKVTEWLGSLMFVAGAGLFAARGRLEKMALGFRPLLRTMLDVDNWFREHPRERTPKARICGRYASLLRYVAREEHGYRALVIVAHSQGTIITADLLRFIHAEAQESGGMANYDPDLARLGGDDLPVYFFTMGCPLRQLYGQRFPYLYEWARFETRNKVKQFDPPDIAADQVPLLEQLGARSWLNAYRSGDYVGRNLWRSDQSSYIWEPGAVSRNEPGTRRELCIGPGAHTHYWDSTARPIADLLDQLIRDSIPEHDEPPRGSHRAHA